MPFIRRAGDLTGLPLHRLKLSRTSSTILGTLLVLLIGLIDYFTDPSLSILYVGPVFLAAWFGGRAQGLAIAFLSALTWFLADMLSKGSDAYARIPYWEGVVFLGFFVVVAWLSSSLRASLIKEQEIARTDHLTGAANARAFAETSAKEIVRASRNGRPFTLVYMDLDNFKWVNDRCGHSTGDRALKLVCDVIREHIRAIDVIGRLGGDEFAILLPETGDEPARAMVSRIHENLLRAMNENGWPITFSLGGVTFSSPPASVDEMLGTADQLMYLSKREGKDRITWKAEEGRI